MTNTAQVVDSMAVIASSLQTNPIQYLALALMGALLSPIGLKIYNQIVNGVIDQSKNPIVHLFGHIVFGVVGGAFTTYMGSKFGATPELATAAVVPFVTVAHWLKAYGFNFDLKNDVNKAEQLVTSPEVLGMLVKISNDPKTTKLVTQLMLVMSQLQVQGSENGTPTSADGKISIGDKLPSAG